MNYLRPVAVLSVLFLTAAGALADGDAPVVPKPRKRLGPAPSREIDKSDGKSVVGSVQTIEKQFLNSFQSYVAASYTELTARLPDEPSLNVRYVIRMTLNTETNESISIAISPGLNERRRLLLLAAISQACKAVICPTEVRKKYGKVLDFSFDLIATQRSGNR